MIFNNLEKRKKSESKGTSSIKKMWNSLTSKFRFGKKKKNPKPTEIHEEEKTRENEDFENLEDFHRISDDEMEYIDYDSEEEEREGQIQDSKKDRAKEGTERSQEKQHKIYSQSEVRSKRLDNFGKLKKIEIRSETTFGKDAEKDFEDREEVENEDEEEDYLDENGEPINYDHMRIVMFSPVKIRLVKFKKQSKQLEKIKRVIIHIHGGGFICMSSSSHQVYLRSGWSLV